VAKSAGITAALEANRKMSDECKTSRHANLNTLMIYDDNRPDHQAEINTDLLAVV